MTSWSDQIADIAWNTKANLELILKIKGGRTPIVEEVYEVTQMLNSLLGLLIIPLSGETTTLPHSGQTGTVTVAGVAVPTRWGPGARRPVSDYVELKRRLRNAVAHHGLVPEVRNEEIEAFTFIDQNPNAQSDWCVIGPLTICQMERLVDQLARDAEARRVVPRRRV